MFSVLFLNSFRRKSLFFSASASRFRAFFPHLSNHFQAFSRAVWEIFLSVSIIFPLFSELSGGNLSAIPVFFGFRIIFSACFVQAPAVFFLRHPDFSPESFAFYGCCLPCFFQPYRYFFPFFCLSRLWKTSCFPVFVRTFCMEPTRAHSHARNDILSTLSGFPFLLPQDMPCNTPDLQRFIKYFSKS